MSDSTTEAALRWLQALVLLGGRQRVFAAVWHPEGPAEEHLPQTAGAVPLTTALQSSALQCVS